MHHAIGVVQQQCQDPGIVELEYSGLPQEGVAERLLGDGNRDVVHAVLMVPGIDHPSGGRGECSLFVGHVNAEGQGTDGTAPCVSNAQELYRRPNIKLEFIDAQHT